MDLIDFSKTRLLTPGPVPLFAKVAQTLSLPMEHHRTPGFEELLTNVWADLAWVFQSPSAPLILTATGTGAMEASVANLLSPGERVLCVDSGKFGDRWATIAEGLGARVHRFSVPWGSSLDLDEFERLVKENNFDFVMSQVCETSTATIHPIKAMAALIHQHSSALFLVDAITGLVNVELPMTDWGLDVVLAGSQKVFGLPTGLAFVALSERAWTKQKTATTPKFYFDFLKERQANMRGETAFSASVTLIRALAEALKLFRTWGLSRVRKRSERLALGTRELACDLGLDVFSQSPSPSVTALTLPTLIDGKKFRLTLEEKFNIVVMGGQDQLMGRILRIGHMGAVTNEDMLTLSRGLFECLNLFGVQISETNWQKAQTKLATTLGEELA